MHINVQLDDHDTPPSVVTKHWIAMERAAGKIGGVVLSLEVHRDSCGPTLTTVDAVRWSAAPQRKPAISLRLRFTPAS